jgi:hypothetical protein
VQDQRGQSNNEKHAPGYSHHPHFSYPPQKKISLLPISNPMEEFITSTNFYETFASKKSPLLQALLSFLLKERI